MNPKIFVITVNWNGFENTAECLDSLSRVDYPNFEIIVVDNGSTDGSRELLQERYPRVILLAHQDNRGLAAANNTGIRYAMRYGADFCLLLNNDTTVDPRILSEFTEAAARYHLAGVFGAKIYYYSDPKRIWWAKPKWNDRNVCFDNIGCDVLDEGAAAEDFSSVDEIDYANGTAMFFRTALVDRVGYIDERFFAYFEEVDWCTRAKRTGTQILFVPGAKVWHKVARSSGGRGSPAVRYFEMRNRFLWARRNLAPGPRTRFYLDLLGSLLPSLSYQKDAPVIKRIYWDCLHFKTPQGRAAVQGCLDYFLGNFGNCPLNLRKPPREKPPQTAIRCPSS